MRRLIFSTGLFAVLACSPLHAAEPELISSPADQRELAITLYGENLALVRDIRRVQLARGTNRLAWRGVSAQVRPETALLRNLGHPRGFFPIEQQFDSNLLTPQKLLDRHVGQEVQVIRSNPASGEETSETARLLAATEGVVLQFADRTEIGVPGRLAFPKVPSDLRDRPTLVVTLQNPADGPQDLELTYLTGGLGWKADYVAQLSPANDRLDLNGWATLTNTSGTRYDHARLQLVAGDVNRVREEADAGMPARALMQAAPRLAEQSFSDYHLYTLDRPTHLADQQTKQVALMAASGVRAVKEYLLRGADYYYRAPAPDSGQQIRIGAFVEFDNRGANLGIPLPAGVVRLYQKDAQGNVQFVGEDRIGHTPKGETVRLKLGDAFDLAAERKQTDFQRLPGSGPHQNIFESAYRIELKNAKDEPVVIKVLEPLPGDWEILNESHPHRKEAAHAAAWQIGVPAGGKAALTYRIRVRY